MKILVLFGNGNKGKTQTLDSLITKLAGPNEENIIEQIKHGNDRCCILIYNDKLIKITTRGDDAKSLEEDFNFKNKEYNIDIFICAARSKGGTHKYINKDIPKIDNVNIENIYWLSKRSISDCSCDGNACSKDIFDYRKKQNEQQVNEIISILDALFKNKLGVQ